MDVRADPVAAKALIGVVPAEARLFERLSGSKVLFSSHVMELVLDAAGPGGSRDP